MRKFIRIYDDRKIFGVCGGLSHYTKTDSIIWRLLFFLLILTPFPIITLYLLTTILTKSV